MKGRIGRALRPSHWTIAHYVDLIACVAVFSAIYLWMFTHP